MSTLNVANISDGTDTVETGYVVNGSAKAWVNMNGTGTIAIRESLNVSSLTDNATGSYFTNFTNAMSSADYGGSASGRTAGDLGFDSTGYNTASRLSIFSCDSAGAASDTATVVGVTLGDLA